MRFNSAGLKVRTTVAALADLKARTAAVIAPLIFATYMPFCAPAVHPTARPAAATQRIAELWSEPRDVASRDLRYGPWGKERAPDPEAVYRVVKVKTHGVSPGFTAEDPNGVKWSVKQGEEGPIEVTLSRVLSAVGYHQPPVYYLPGVRIDHGSWIERAPGGRFRPHEKDLKEDGSWSWQQNPFVGTKPYQGLLVILEMFDSSDLKNSNNSLYKLKKPREGADRWFVVRDIGTALGETGRMNPKRNDPDLFERLPFIKGVKNGFVEFAYNGWHQELFRNRITPDDVRWACDLLAKLSDAQWRDAFDAGGYDPAVGDRFIRRIKQKIREGQQLGTASAMR